MIVWVLHCNYAAVASTWSTPEAAMAHENAQRNHTLNPEAYVWTHYRTDDGPDGEMYETQFPLAYPAGQFGTAWITRTVIDAREVETAR